MAVAAVGQKLLWTKTSVPPGGGGTALYFRYQIHSVVWLLAAKLLGL